MQIANAPAFPRIPAAPLDVKGTYFYNRIAFAGTYIPCPKHMETYRSGHNGAHSKCVSRFPARGFESLRLRQIS